MEFYWTFIKSSFSSTNMTPSCHSRYCERLEMYYESWILRLSRSGSFEDIESWVLFPWPNDKLIEGGPDATCEMGMATIVGTISWWPTCNSTSRVSLMHQRPAKVYPRTQKIFLDITSARHAVRTDALCLLKAGERKAFRVRNVKIGVL